MVSRYHRFLICLFLLVTTACASPDSAPTSETAAATRETAMLSWDANSAPDLEGYKIYLATASGGYGAPIATVPRNITTYTVTGLETVPLISSWSPHTIRVAPRVPSQTK
jgi:hypothetical protein